jgi:hypothetical protein
MQPEADSKPPKRATVSLNKTKVTKVVSSRSKRSAALKSKVDVPVEAVVTFKTKARKS